LYTGSDVPIKTGKTFTLYTGSDVPIKTGRTFTGAQQQFWMEVLPARKRPGGIVLRMTWKV